MQNNGESAGQTVNHFHLHLIPRYDDNQKLEMKPMGATPEDLDEVRTIICG